MSTSRTATPPPEQILRRQVDDYLAGLSERQLKRFFRWRWPRRPRIHVAADGRTSRIVQYWTEEEVKLLGTMPDEQLAKLQRSHGGWAEVGIPFN